MERIKALALIAGILAIAGAASAAAYQDLPDVEQTVEDEQWRVNVGEFVILDGNAVGENGRDFVVRNSSGVRLNDTHYNVSSDPIAIEATPAQEFTNNTTASVDYAYTGKPIAAQQVRGFAALAVQILGFLVLIGGAIFVLYMVRVLLRESGVGGGLR